MKNALKVDICVIGDVAGEFYTPLLFSERTKIVCFLRIFG